MPFREIEIHPQFWDRSTPSLFDAVATCVLLARVLESALPIALSHIGEQSLHDQAWFWESVWALDRETDFGAGDDFNPTKVSDSIGDLVSIMSELRLKLSEATEREGSDHGDTRD